MVDDNNSSNPEFALEGIEIFDNPDIAIAPTVTTAPDPTVAPDPTITIAPITGAPKLTSTPVPVTKAPTATTKPTVTNPVESAKGDKVTVGNGTYKVTATGSSKTVGYAGYTGILSEKSQIDMEKYRKFTKK